MISRTSIHPDWQPPNWRAAGFTEREINILRSCYVFRDCKDGRPLAGLIYNFKIGPRAILDILRRSNRLFDAECHFSTRTEVQPGEAITSVLCRTKNSLPPPAVVIDNLDHEPDLVSLTDLEEQPL